MSTESQRAIVEQIVSKTQDGKLEWKPDPNNGDPYTKIGSYFVLLQESRNAVGAKLFTVRVQDSGENDVDVFNDEDLDAADSNKYYKLLKELIEYARRSATGADKSLSEILSRLKNM